MKTIELTLPTSIKDLPVYSYYQTLSESVHEFSQKTREKASYFFDYVADKTEKLYSSIGSIDYNRRASSFDASREGKKFSSLSKFTKWRPSKKVGKSIVYCVVLVVLILGARSILGTSATSPAVDQVEIEGPKAETEINKEFFFPLVDGAGEVVSEYKYIIEGAELRNEILVQGVPARAIKDRTFLIINLKIVNEYNQAIEVNASDFVRLSINGNASELLAPDIHSDPVRIQAISTKNTRIGFPISDFDTNLILQVGEINGDKEIVEINL